MSAQRYQQTNLVSLFTQVIKQVFPRVHIHSPERGHESRPGTDERLLATLTIFAAACLAVLIRIKRLITRELNTWFHCQRCHRIQYQAWRCSILSIIRGRCILGALCFARIYAPRWIPKAWKAPTDSPTTKTQQPDILSQLRFSPSRDDVMDLLFESGLIRWPGWLRRYLPPRTRCAIIYAVIMVLLVDLSPLVEIAGKIMCLMSATRVRFVFLSSLLLIS